MDTCKTPSEEELEAQLDRIILSSPQVPPSITEALSLDQAPPLTPLAPPQGTLPPQAPPVQTRKNWHCPK